MVALAETEGLCGPLLLMQPAVRKSFARMHREDCTLDSRDNCNLHRRGGGTGRLVRNSLTTPFLLPFSYVLEKLVCGDFETKQKLVPSVK